MRSSPTPPAPLPPAGRLRLTEEGVMWLAGAAVVGGLGWLKGMSLVLVLAYGMAALVVLNAVLCWRHGRRVTAAADPAGPVFAGEEVRLTVRLRNADRRPADGVVVDHGGLARWAVERVPAAGEVVLARRTAFPRRGRQPLGRPVARCGFPFGFVRYDRPGADGGGLAVLPAVGTVDPAGLRRAVVRAAGGDDRSRAAVRRPTGEPADVRGVRPYRTGDGLRLVHWPSSARHRKLMVREYDAAAAPELVLAVEPWLPADPTPADRDRLEAALSLAATLAKAWCERLDGRVTLWVAGGEAGPQVIRPDRAFDRAALMPLADAAGGPAFDPPGPGQFGRAGAAVRVVVSSRAGPPLAAALGAVALDPKSRPAWYRPPVGE